MSAAPPLRAVAPRGYVSEDAKRRFQVTAGVLGGLFAVGQFVVPMVASMAMMPMMFFPSFTSMRTASPGGGALWGDAVWYTEQPLGPSGRPLLQELPIEGDAEPVERAELPVTQPWLLPGGEGLWVITSDYVGYFRDGELEDVVVGATLYEIAPPFLLEGRPAVVARAESGLRLLALREGEWREEKRFGLGLGHEIESMDEQVRVLAIGDRIWLFYSDGTTLRWWNALPDDEDLSGTFSSTSIRWTSWQVVVLDGAPALFVASDAPFAKLTGYRLRGGRWEQFFTHEAGFAGEFGAFPTGAGDEFVLLTQGMPGSVRLVRVRGGQVVRQARFGQGFPFFGNMMWVMLLPQWGMMALSLLLAYVLAVQMAKHRVCEYAAEGMTVPLASLWRRGLAQAVDSLILGWAMLLSTYFIFSGFSDFEGFFMGGWRSMAVGFGLMALGWVWALGGLVLFGYLEGKHGQTPGKRLLGIRVVGLDLQPCGFGRGFVRKILVIVDGMFNFVVGMLLVAYTEHWQRVGDLAARTIVIDARRPPEPLPQATIVG